MWVLAKKKLEFCHPVSGETFPMRPDDFRDAPEWIEKDPLFAWAIKEGSLVTVKHDLTMAVQETPEEPTAEEPVAEKPAEPKKSSGKRKTEPKKEADEA